MHKIRQSAGKSFAYILGVYLGDGCVTRPSTRSAEDRLCFKLNTIDEDFAEAVRAALRNMGFSSSVSKHAVKRSTKPNFSLYSGCHDLCLILREDTQGKKRIPNYVVGWEDDVLLAFIAGLMDSEGFVAANSSPTNRRYYMGYKSCDLWVPEFVRLLEKVGIKIGKVGIERPRKEGYKTPMRFTIKMQSWIDSGAYFNISRKQDRVIEWASFGPYEKRALHPRRLSPETNTPSA